MEKLGIQCEDHRKRIFHLSGDSGGRFGPCYSGCDCIKSSELRKIRVLNHSHSILIIFDECEHRSFINAFKFDGEDLKKIYWTWEDPRRQCDNHIIRNNSVWLFHIFTDHLHGTFLQTSKIEHDNDGYQSTEHFEINLRDIQINQNSACEVFEDIFYFIKREICVDAESGQRMVNYRGIIAMHGPAPDEDDYYPSFKRRLEFNRAFHIHGQVIFAELSLRKDPDTGSPTIVDRIGQEHARNPSRVSWICFSQIIQFASFLNTRPLSLGELQSSRVILFSGPEHIDPPDKRALESLPRPLGDVDHQQKFEDGVILQALRPRYKMPQFGPEQSIFGFLWIPYCDVNSVV